MSVKCDIVFEDSPSKVVYSGQLLKGTVIVNLKQETVIQGVYLRILGEAYCKLGVENPSAKRPQIVPVGTEKYLDERITCFDGSNEKVRLEAGTHQYPFECQLMTMIPTSLEEKHGHIRYTASIRFNDFWEVSPIHEENFTVVKPLNLNLLPNLHEPYSTEHKQGFYYTCFCPFCESDEMIMTVRVPQRGYTPGQSIDVQLNIHNKSSEEVSSVVLQIVKEVKFLSNNGVTTELIDSPDIGVQAVDGFDSGMEKMKTYRIPIVVPSTPPSDEETSSIIKISYKLQVAVIVGLCHTDPIISIPIVIGTYPIAERQWANTSNVFLRQVDEIDHTAQPVTNQPTTSTSHDVASAPLLPKFSQSDHPTPRAPFPESDPPTYEEAMNNSTTDSNQAFKPKYPVYRRAN